MSRYCDGGTERHARDACVCERWRRGGRACVSLSGCVCVRVCVPSRAHRIKLLKPSRKRVELALVAALRRLGKLGV